MSETIVGRTIISDSYGHSVSALPDKPEPPKREVVRLTAQDLCRRQKWTEAQLETAQNLEDPLKFPAANFREVGLLRRRVYVWREDNVDEWLDRVRTHAAMLTALVKK